MSKYELVILTDRSRGEPGDWNNNIFEAENDLEALIYVSYMYEPYGKAYNEEIEVDEDGYYNYLRTLYEKNKEEALNKAKSLLECDDPTDYYDNVAYVKNLETKENIFEDDCFINAYDEDMESMFEDEDEDFDEDE